METQPDIIGDVRSFMKSRVILSAAEFNFFTTLDTNFLSAKELADMLGLNDRVTIYISRQGRLDYLFLVHNDITMDANLSEPINIYYDEPKRCAGDGKR